ncbi:MAG: hypothetical protein P1U53_09205 [Sulfitobacter sp.]|nr:hypothetical protein [Sulfitobacter sp.]
MTTWTSKRGMIGALAALILAGCEGSDLGTTLDALSTPRNAALSSVTLSEGGVTILPPQGYCIDRASVQRAFALMARCDALGGEGGTGAPTGILSVSLTDASDESLPTPAEKAEALGLTSVGSQTTEVSFVVFRATGDAPAPGLSEEHWRGLALVGEHMIGLAFFSATGSDAGRALLLETIQRTQRQNG